MEYDPISDKSFKDDEGDLKHFIEKSDNEEADDRDYSSDPSVTDHTIEDLNMEPVQEGSRESTAQLTGEENVDMIQLGDAQGNATFLRIMVYIDMGLKCFDGNEELNVTSKNNTPYQSLTST
jgi:hypothetical protein